MPIAGHDVTNNGTLAYNGVLFNRASRVRVSSEPVRDDASLTTIHRKYTINVQTVFAREGQSSGGNGTDFDLQSIRSLLSEDGKALWFVNKGFGADLLINTPGGTVQDVRMGPKPEILAWRPIGAANACEVEWEVTTCVPECEAPYRIRRKGVSAFNFDIDWDVNEHGDLVRTTTGYIQIVQVRNDRRLSDSADVYYPQFVSPPPKGFKRLRRRHISADRSRLDIQIVDVQIPSPNAYPKDVTEIRGDHTLAVSRQQGGFKMARNVITADIIMKRGVSGAQAWIIFLKILQKRMQHVVSKNNAVFLDEVSLSEDLFGRRASFAASFRATTKLGELVTYSGLWEPLDDFNWKDWHDSLKNDAQSPRGNLGIYHHVGSDVIVDLCGNPPAAQRPTDPDKDERPKKTRPSPLENKKPPPDKSWLAFENEIMHARETPAVRHAILQTPLSTQPVTRGTGLQVQPNQMSAPYNTGRYGTVDAVIQNRGTPLHTIRMKGKALRVGHEINPPRILNADVNVIESHTRFMLRVVGEYFGIKLYKAEWDMTYLAPNSIGQISAPEPPP